MQSVKVKAAYQSTIRALTIEIPTQMPNNFTTTQHLEQLQQNLAMLFGLQTPISITYKDEDNDIVLIGSDQELFVATQFSSGTALHLLVNGAKQQEQPVQPMLPIHQAPLKFEQPTVVENLEVASYSGTAPLLLENPLRDFHGQHRGRHGHHHGCKGHKFAHLPKKERLEARILRIQEKLNSGVDEHKQIKLQNKLVRVRSKLEGVDIKENAIDKREMHKKLFDLKVSNMQQKIEIFANAGNEQKVEKIQKRMEKVIERRESRVAKFQKRMEKKQHREECKSQKRDYRQYLKQEKQQDKQLTFSDVDLEQGWPSDIHFLCLDGNNMLFVQKCIRELTLKNKQAGEALLNEVSREFGSMQRLALTRVVYDSTNNVERGDTFNVSSARPQYATADDALVDVAKQAAGVNLDHALFVTSDVELTHRLRQTGAKVIKPGQFFNYAFALLNVQNQYATMDELCEKRYYIAQ
jgi:rRNA-processing protein FCF1